MTTELAIIDSGGANIASVSCALQRLGKQAVLTRDADVIRSAARVLLPGVGAARDAMQRLRDFDLVDVIRSLRQPVLGICLGMQLLAEASEEENVECLGVIPGTALRLPDDTSMPVPNMGWCALQRDREHPLLQGIEDGAYCYFLHSFALPVSSFTLASAQHAEPFSAVIAHKNYSAAQFHPERSSQVGARLLKNFLGLSS